MTNENNNLSADYVEGVAAKRLLALTGQFLELQTYTQSDQLDWLREVLDGATECRLEIVLSKSGSATLRLLGVDGAGNEERVRILEFAKPLAN